MSRMAKEWRSQIHSEGSSAPPSPSRGKAAPKMNGLLSRKQSGWDTPKLSSSTGSSQRLAAKLSELLTRLQGNQEAQAALTELSEDVKQLRTVEEEITGYAEQALEETERLKQENEDLRKAAEDAALDKRMSSAVAEAEKLKAAGDAHKRDLVQAKLVEREAELASMRDKLRAANREASNMTRALSEARNATTARAREAEVLKQELAQLRAGSSAAAEPSAPQDGGEQPAKPESRPAAPAAAQSTSPLASEHAEIAARLMAAGPGGVDIALLTAAAKALRDVSVLDKQFLRAREEKEALAREVEHLNSTVFSKHFKAPSAWAEREVKYKMEKRDWDAEKKKLRELLQKLEAENATYRASNKTAEFEAQIQELKAVVEAKEAEKVEVQKQLHELQIQGRPQDAPPREDHEAVQGIIGDMEAHGIGHAAPVVGTPSASSRGSPSQSMRGSPPRAAVPPPPVSSHYLPGSNVEDIIQDYDEKGVGIGQVRAQRRERAASRLAHSNGLLPVNRSSDSLDGVHSADVRHLQSSFDGAEPAQRDGATTRSTSYGSLHSNQALDSKDPSGQASAELDAQPDRLHNTAQHSSAHEPAAQLSSQQPAMTVGLDRPGAVLNGEVTPSPSAERKEWGPFGSPVELTAASASDKGTPTARPTRRPFPGAPASAEAEAPCAAPAVSLEASAPCQGGAAEQQHPQQLPGSAQAQHLDSSSHLKAEQEQRERADGLPQSLPPENWAPVRSRLLTADDGLSETSSSAGALAGARGHAGATHSIGRDSSSDGGDEWDTERRAALRADRAAVEAAWGAHVADNDVASLRWKAAEADSQVQLYRAQISKMQLALERADQENSRVEQELRIALAAPGKLREAQAEKRAGASSLAALRDRVRSMSLLAPSAEPNAEERLQDAREHLKSSQHELAAIQKQRDDLARQLAHIAEKISSGMIPDLADLTVPEHIKAAAEASASTAAVEGESKPTADTQAVGRPRLSSTGHVYAGLSDEEVEVMRLRDENEALMETLVRAKVELAETQGDYLKTKRALLRAVEKQAMMAEKLDNLKMAVGDNDIAGASTLLASPARAPAAQKLPAGVLTPLGEDAAF